MTVTIIGLGLIGGSFAKALKKSGFATKIIGIDNNEAHIKTALQLNLVDEISNLEKGITQANIIIVAIPVHDIVSLVPIILDKVSNQVVMDVGSTKASLISKISNHKNRGRFVGTHPMAGTEYSGPEAALEDLFNEKCAVIVDRDDSDKDALKLIEKLYNSLNMDLVYHDAEDHDIHSAYVSHISHISSMALALTVLEKEKNEKRIFELAGGGFNSSVRLAKSNADTWIPIFEQNRDNILDVLDEHINTISRFRTLLIKKDFTTFRDLIIHANDIKRIIKNQ